MKASDLFVRCLENEGVEYIFGIPGEENLDVMDSMIGSKLKFITTRHEQGRHLWQMFTDVSPARQGFAWQR